MTQLATLALTVTLVKLVCIAIRMCVPSKYLVEVPAMPMMLATPIHGARATVSSQRVPVSPLFRMVRTAPSLFNALLATATPLQIDAP